MSRLLGYFAPHSDPWFAAREGRIGGSEVAAILGISKWESPFSLWHRKAGLIPPQDDNSQMEVGRYIEAAALAWFSDRHPEMTIDPKPGTYVHAEHDWMLANPDGIAASKDGAVIVESKFAIYDDEWWNVHGEAEPPAYYVVQVQWYLHVMGLQRAHIVVLFGGAGLFREYVVDSDPELQRTLIERAAAFLVSMRDGERPNLDDSTHTYEAVRRLHSQIEDDLDVEVGAEVRDEWLRARVAADQIEREKREASTVLLDAMGEARRACVDGIPFARRQPTGRNRSAVALYQIKPKPQKKDTTA